MSLSILLQSSKQEFSFDDLPSLLDLSPGYTRKVVADLVKNDILMPFKDRKDKRKLVYKLNWPAIRNYLLSNPKDYDEIINKIAGDEYPRKYVAIDNFQVIAAANDLMTLTQELGALPKESTILITNVGQPEQPLILETG